MIYLDNAASTPVIKEVKEKLNSVLEIYGNPSSIHEEGKKAKNIINESKKIISNKINCYEDEIFFTSGSTMSNNLILQGFPFDIHVSSIEHEDILMMAKDYGFNIIPVENDGSLNLEKLIDEFKYIGNNKPHLFSIQMANSEIGTIQDIKKISELIHTFPNTFLHVDATQYIPYYNIDVKELKIDALSMSGQKINCIKGIGLLYVSKSLQDFVLPIIYGKQGLVGGTENVLGIACIGEAFNHIPYNNKDIVIMRDMLINGLNGKLIGSNDRLPNNVCMLFEDVDANDLVLMLNEYGICCSTGSACSSGDKEPSNTLLSIGLTPKDANCCVRFTVGKQNTNEEIKEVIKVTNFCVDILRELKG